MFSVVLAADGALRPLSTPRNHSGKHSQELKQLTQATRGTPPHRQPFNDPRRTQKHHEDPQPVISPFVTSVEVEAHLRATPGNASLALEIIRRQWGYMLDHFSNSTTIEAYYETGELMCPFYGLELGNYISHAHAWSTGPTASLTLHVGGLSPVTDAGKTWEFVPHAAGADVDELHTGYTLATGDFSVEWTTKNEDSFFFANLETPRSTTGFISVPTFGKSLDAIEISINGNTVWANGAASWSGFGAASGSADFVTVAEVPHGGWLSIVAKDA